MMLIPLLLCAVLLYQTARARGLGRCDAGMAAAVMFGIYLTAITEVLSAVKHLDRLGIFWAWLIGAVVVAGVWYRLRRGAVALPNPPVAPAGRFPLSIAVIVICLVLVGVGGLVSAPSNWDSMTYHLPRVMHWMENRSVADYATNCSPQLFQPPWAEFAILHLQLLWGSDRFAFLPQWAAMCGCVAAVFSLARRLGAGPTGRVIAVLFTVTLPMALLQAESTQNNLVLGFWLLCWANGIVMICGHRTLHLQTTLSLAALTGGAIGLAMLTKGTAYVIGAPLLLWLVIAQLRSGKRGIALLLTTAAIAAALNAGHWTRNWNRFGSPLTPPEEAAYKVQGMSPQLWLGNVVRNLAVEVATPSRRLNDTLAGYLDQFQQSIGVDPNDPLTTPPLQRFTLRPPHNGEDLTGNPFHLLLLIVVVFLLVLRLPRKRLWVDSASQSASALLMLAVPICGFGLFCAMLKWQQFHTRLHLPMFLLAAAPAGYFLERWVDRRLGFSALGVLSLLAIEVILENPGHPWLTKGSIFTTPRERQYFSIRPELYAPYLEAAEIAARQPDGRTGLLAGPNDWEYPLWILMHNRLGRWPRIEEFAADSVTEASMRQYTAIISITNGRPTQTPAGWQVVHCGNSVDVWLRPLAASRTTSPGSPTRNRPDHVGIIIPEMK